MARRIKESTLNKKVIDFINNLPNAYAEKQKAGPANPGALDVTGCINGWRVELEGKIGDNRPTKLQMATIERWKRCGCIAGWYNSFEDAVKIIGEGIYEKQKKNSNS